MDRAALAISLPQTRKDYIAAMLRDGCFSAPSEYIRSLVPDDMPDTAGF